MTQVFPSDTLAAFVSELNWQDVPESARKSTRRTVANVVGLAVGAAYSDPVEATVRSAEDLGTFGVTALLGRPETVPAPWAALVTGIAAHVEDFDDTYLPCVLHPGAPVVSAALSAAQLAGADGATTLTGVVAGVEVASRLGDALGNDHFDRGWHVTGTVGMVGAACAASRVLGLDREQTLAAMAVASTQAAGHTEQLGSSAKSVHAGRSAANGLEAALLARRGFTAPAEPLAGRRGMAALMTDEADWSGLADLGTRWLVEANAIKPYSCGIVSHGVIDAGIALRERLSADDIAEVSLQVHPRVLDVMGVKEPETGLRSKFSVYHCFAVGLLDGAGGPDQFSDGRAQDRVVSALRRRVRVSPEAAMPLGAARAEVHLVSGETVTHDVTHATGSVEEPMSDSALREKFDSMVRSVGVDSERLWSLAHGLDSLDDVAVLFTAAR